MGYIHFSIVSMQKYLEYIFNTSISMNEFDLTAIDAGEPRHAAGAQHGVEGAT